MNTANFRRLVALLIVLASTAALHAQFPADNAVWKMRCDLLAQNESAILNGNAPKELVAATRGVAGQKFSVLAFDRSQNNAHAVACATFYLGAIANRAGNGGKQDAAAAQALATLAQFENKIAHGQQLSFTEKLKKDEIKSRYIGKDLSLNQQEATAVVQAASTSPIALTPEKAAPAKASTQSAASLKTVAYTRKK